MKEVQQLLGFCKTNTTAYHPQTDGLVERFNRTLTSMLAKTVEKGGRDWDRKLPFVLFAYRASQQQSTLESPFFLLYGRDPRLPTDPLLSPVKTKKMINLKEYGLQLAHDMSEAWELARQCIGKAQRRQKEYYDRRGRPPNFRAGERVFLYKPAEKTGEARKFARPYHGPYCIVEVDTNTARIRRVDKPEEDTIRVSLDRLRRCPVEAPDQFWPPDKTARRKKGRLMQSPPSGRPKTDVPDAGGTPGMDGEVTGETLSSDLPDSVELDDPAKRCGKAACTLAETGGQEGFVNEETIPDAQDTTKTSAETRKSKWAGRLRKNPLKRVESVADVCRGGVVPVAW